MAILGKKKKPIQPPSQYFTAQPTQDNPGNMANTNIPQRSGLHLGIANQKNKAAFFAAADKGPQALDEFLMAHKRIGRVFSKRARDPRFYEKAKSYYQPVAGPPAGPAPVPEGDRNQRPFQFDTGFGPDTMKQMQDLIPFFQAGMGNLGNAYMDNMARGKFLDMPSFDELYNSYRDVGEREANRQAGNIVGGFSGRGAGYSSDILNSQGDIRKQMFQDLADKAAQFKQGLRQQQFGELYGMTGLEQTQRENALNRMFGQFNAQTQLPPMLRPPSATEPTTIVR